MRRLVLPLVLTCLAAAGLRAASCTPVSATLCMGVDDYGDVWINGQCVGATCTNDFYYIDNTDSAPVQCVSVPVGILDPSGINYVAVRVRNTNPTEMWGTWALDIVCSSGAHSYITSNDTFDFYNDPSGTNPPPLEGGLPWYDPGYMPSTPWGVPSTTSGSVYGKRAVDPQTGLLLPPRSWTATASASGTTEVMYFRQGFGITPVPTPVPPQFSLGIQAPCSMTSGANFDFTLHVCNAGGNVTTTTTITLTRDPEVAFNGPWSPSGWSVASSGSTDTITIPGFPAATCQDYTLQLVDWYIGPAEDNSIRTFSAVLLNAASGSGDSAGASVAATNCIFLSPTPTRSFSPSPQPSPTFTVSPTPAAPSATPTVSPTATASLTPPPSPTLTPSPTVTLTGTPPPTPPPPTPTPLPLLLTPLHPNPAPAATEAWIPYVISTDAEVSMRIFDVSGETVLELGPLFQLKGAHERRWDLLNAAGTPVASGVYLCRITARSQRDEQEDAWVKVAVAR